METMLNVKLTPVKMPVINLSHLERAVLGVLQARAQPMTLPEIESALYLQNVSFTQPDLALAVVRLQELNLIGNTLAFMIRPSKDSA